MSLRPMEIPPCRMCFTLSTADGSGSAMKAETFKAAPSRWDSAWDASTPFSSAKEIIEEIVRDAEAQLKALL